MADVSVGGMFVDTTRTPLPVGSRIVVRVSLRPEDPAPLHGLMKSNPNVLTNNNHCDPMYGSPDLTALLCKVYKAEDGK